MVYSPLDRSPDLGKIRILSNDPDKATFDVAILTPALEPNIFSNPTIVFQRVAPVTDATRDKTYRLSEVQNTGQAPLEISRAVITGSSDFKITYPTSADVNADPATDGANPPTVLQPDQSFPIRVYFNPVDNNPSTADLIFFSNDPDSPQYSVSLQGNSGAPCIKLSREDEINFGEGGIGFANNKTITIENCSPTQDLNVSDIEISDDGGGVYAIKEGSLPAGLPAAPAIIPPDNTASFVVTYTPTAEIVSNGEMTVRSNDPAKSVLKVPIVGKGTTNVCPQAIGQARLSDSPQSRQELATIPLKTVLLDGTQSVDANGSIASYEWTIIQRPPNSTARLDPTNTDPQPSLFLDLAGVYVIELTVYDEQGLASCNDDETRRVTISAVPDEDIHVQLVWDTPADPNQSDTNGTDVDLHYLNPNGRWNQAPNDIFWRNRTADWGAPGPSDDPSLDIDDTDGAGPENVNHNNPESGLIYSVGVYYYADKGLGASYATLRIYIQGTQRYEYRNQFLPQEETFWRAAAITWPGGQISAINQVSSGFPGQ
ncbi:MAG: choice-of-anchor D domain-containing protein [bacterium]